MHNIAYIPYLIFMVNNPCCPNKISCANVKIASQNTGEISTPKAGGTTPLTIRSSGSVGMTKSTQGTSVSLVSGYQLKTTRANMAKDMRFKKGSKKDAKGCTHASVSASSKLLLAAAIEAVVSTTVE